MVCSGGRARVTIRGYCTTGRTGKAGAKTWSLATKSHAPVRICFDGDILKIVVFRSEESQLKNCWDSLALGIDVELLLSTWRGARLYFYLYIEKAMGRKIAYGRGLPEINKTGTASVLMPQYDNWYEKIFSTSGLLLPWVIVLTGRIFSLAFRASDSTGVMPIGFVTKMIIKCLECCTYHFRQVDNWYVAEVRHIAERTSKFEGE